MPMKLIYNLQISLKQKAGLVCVFSLCLVMIVFAIIRAKQVLVDQYFVNLVLLELWSTLASSICKSPFPITLRSSTRQGQRAEPQLIMPSSCDSRMPPRVQIPNRQPAVQKPQRQRLQRPEQDQTQQQRQQQASPNKHPP